MSSATGGTGQGLRLVRCATRTQAEATVAAFVAAAVRADPGVVLSLATGKSMIGVYDGIIAAHRAGLSLAGITAFGLDEYFGLPPEHPALFRNYMRRHLIDRTDLRDDQVHFPSEAAGGAAFECAIREAGGVDLQLLGIGRNGHIGFNEPGAAPDSRTRVAALEPSTIAANAADFPGEETAPANGMTMGIATILDARRIVLIATGEAKAEAIAGALQGPITTNVPASFLQRHPDATIVCDEAAASLLGTSAPERNDNGARARFR